MIVEKRKVYGTIIGVTLFVLFILGITYAIFQWTSGTNNNTNVKLTVSKDLENLIIYKQGNSILETAGQTLEASENYSGGISATIEFYKKPTTKIIYGRINMEILNMLSASNTTDANIKKTDTIKWAITTWTSSNTTETLLNEGTFNGKEIGNMFPLHQDFELSTTRTFFKIYLWFDQNAVNEELSVSGELLSTEISAEATDVMSMYGDAAVTLNNLGLSVSSGTPDFSKTSCSSGCEESTVGIYESQDDLGTTYYFRGDVTNNYVYFANYYWRIIRINGDGGIRMIYDGTTPHDNGESSTDRQIGTSAFNSSASSNTYVGYKYGSPTATTYEETHKNTTNSTIKQAVDSWYKTNISDKEFSSYLVDSIYCNDRSLSSGTGIGTTETNYKALERLNENKTPTFYCTQSNDKFTVNTSKGNGSLQYPVGLITADEVAYAGGVYNTNNSKYYLYNGNNYWTMSPAHFGGAIEFGLYPSGNLGVNVVSPIGGIRPVITLNGSTKLQGTGIKTDPFRLPDPEPNAPDIVDGLIPVVYDENKNTWVKADSENTNGTWYDYDNKLWANAVLVTSTNRSAYQRATPGTTISTSDILAYYVWIPRYKYKVWNINKVIGTDSYSARIKGIDIVFENEKESTGTISCTYSFKSPSSSANSPNETCTGSNGDYYTHPAFTFGSNNTRGFWMGKFELTSGVSGLTVLPNVSSLRNTDAGTFSTMIQDMQTSNNIYGLSTSRTNADSHMLTNYEWGAVAYLTNSKYGRCTNGSCTEVTTNNCESYITGIGANSISAVGSSSTCTNATNKYNGTKGVLASTTGNITGVYDMSGGAYENTTGNMSYQSGRYTFFPSNNFSETWYTTSTAKYLTTYAYGESGSDQTAYNRSRLGDATGEVAVGGGLGWHSDFAYFLGSNSSSWFIRGGEIEFGGNNGVFSFGGTDGDASSRVSTRAILVSLK